MTVAEKYGVDNLSRVHGGKYDYSLYEYNGAEVHATFICPRHGEFRQNPYSHAKGYGCARCSAEERADRLRMDNFVERAEKTHGDLYDYSRVKYKNSETKVEIVCSTHGSFFQLPHAHLGGQGCPTCGYRKGGLARRLGTEEFVRKARDVFGDTFDYSKTQYVLNGEKVLIVCPAGHEFYQQPNNHLTGYGCPFCQISPLHRYLIEQTGGEANNRSVLGNGQEIDLWFPKERMAFELNGVYWHSSLHKERAYHQNKTEVARERGIDLWHLWVDRYTDQEKLLSWVNAKLGRVENTIFARKTRVVPVSSEDFRRFLDHNHLQGAIDARVRLGLEYNGSLVSVMGFKKHADGWHLSRFASLRDTRVVGGFSRLLTRFERAYQPERLVSYSDDAYSNGDVYLNNGFSLVRHSSAPKLYYTNGVVLRDRWHFQRKTILSRNPGMELGTEREMAAQEGFYPLYGCKTRRWERLFNRAML